MCDHLRGQHDRGYVAGGAPSLQRRAAAAGAAARRRGATGRITGGCDLARLERDLARGDCYLGHEIAEDREHRVRDGGAARHRAACSYHALTAAAGRGGS